MAPPLTGSSLILHRRCAQGSHPLARAGPGRRTSDRASKIARDITWRKKAASALAEGNLQLALAERAALVNRPRYCNAMGDFRRWPLTFTTSRGHACSISARGKDRALKTAMLPHCAAS